MVTIDGHGPRTSNPHLLVTRRTAHDQSAVSEFWLSSLLRHLPVTLRQLREDRILDEARATEADPLHLSAMFGLGADAGLRYTHAVQTEADSRTPPAFSANRASVRPKSPSEFVNPRASQFDGFYCLPGVKGGGRANRHAACYLPHPSSLARKIKATWRSGTTVQVNPDPTRQAPAAPN
jgi:hypothetical protein